MKKNALTLLFFVLSGACGANAASLDSAGARVQFVLTASGKSCPSNGSAIAVSDNFFLTAAHVIQVKPEEMKTCGIDEALKNKTGIKNGSYVIHGGKKKRLVKMWGVPYDISVGDITYPGGKDLGYISTAKRAEGISDNIAVPICNEMPPIGSTVRFVSNGTAANVRLVDPKVDNKTDQAYFAISEVLPPGNSGGGIFDPNKDCLLGVISHQWPRKNPEMTRFSRITKDDVMLLIRRAKAEY